MTFDSAQPRRASTGLVASPGSHDGDEFRTREAFGMEQRVLGSIMQDNSILNEALRRGVSHEHFFRQDHQAIFAAMLSLNRQGKPIGEVTLHDELISTFGDSGEFRVLMAYASSLTQGLPEHKLVEQASHAVEIVKREWALRKVATFCNSSMNALKRYGVNAVALVKDATNFFQSIHGELERGKAGEISPLTLPDLPDSVLDGRLGEIVQRRLSRFPRAYSWPSTLTVAGAMVPRTPDVHTNLYGALVGDVGSGKSQTIKQSIRVLGLTAPTLEDVMSGSAEGLLAKLENANGAARLISVDELAHLLSKAQIDRASFPFVLNRAFDTPAFSLTIARGKQINVNVSLSVIGGIVEENFQQAFGSATTGGLHDRFVFGLCPRPFEFQYHPFEGNAETTDPCQVTISPDVWDARNSWLKEIPNLTGRHATNSLRAAIIASAFSRRPVLRAKDLGPAREFAIYQARVGVVLRPDPGENTDARCANAIISALSAANGNLVSRRDLMKKIHPERLGPTACEKALKALILVGTVEEIGGRYRLGKSGGI